MKSEVIIEKLHEFFNLQLDKISTGNPIVGICKPLVVKVVDNKLDDINKALKLLADKDGDIDIISLINDMETNLINTSTFTMNNSMLGDINIGGGKVKFTLPFINKDVVFNQEDITLLKESLNK